MNRDLIWLTDAQFSRIEPHLPTDTCGKARVDDQRVISGIVHVMKSGGRWRCAARIRSEEDALQLIRSLGRQRRLGRFVSYARTGWRSTCASPDRQFRRQSASVGCRRKRGEKNQAIGRSRGGRTTKIHALTDARCRPIAFMLTGGQIPDCTAGAALIEQLPACEILHAHKGYDSNAIREQVQSHGAMPNIPPKINRKWKTCFSPFLYRNATRSSAYSVG